MLFCIKSIITLTSKHFYFQILQGKLILVSLQTLKANNGLSNDVKNTIELLTQCIYIIIDYESKIVDIS